VSRIASGHPGASQLSDEFAEAPRLEAGEDTLGQGRAAQVMRHNITQAARPASCHDSAAIVIAHHVVKSLIGCPEGLGTPAVSRPHDF
jgi:hypothetical protein